MTRLIPLLFAVVILLAACNNNKSKETNSTATNNETTTNGTTNTNPATNNTGSDDMVKAMEQMKKMPALSTDQIKSIFPETLIGMKRVSYSANSMLGYGVGEARYKSDDGKEIKVSIWDCVGEAGVGFYNLMYWGMNMESEDENGYKKTITYNGTKAIESYEKNQERYGLMFPANNRLLVNVEGDNTGLDMVKQAAGGLNLKVN